MSEIRRDAVEQEQADDTEVTVDISPEDNTRDRVVRRRGVLGSVLTAVFWPFSIVVRAYRRFWLFLGFRRPEERVLVGRAVSSPRHSLTGRKRLHRITRLLLSILPRWVQGALGYPVSSSIGRSLSPEIRVSPTKPCGKGSKRKQDELEEEEDHHSWVEVLTQDIADNDPEEDPDFEPITIDTESEEYCSQNDTESDLEIGATGVIIKDVKVDV